MTKRKQELAVLPAETKTADVGRFEITADVAQLAVTVGIDLGGSVEDRADMAAAHMNRSQRHMLASGLLLASIKAECEHGEFTDLVTARGFEERAARKAMQYAQFIATRPTAERARLLEWPKSKVMELARADPEVLDVMLLDGAQGIDTLSVRALRQKIADLEAGLTDATVQRDTAEAELAGARKRLARGLHDRDDNVPVVVADLRAEIVAGQKRAELAIAGLRGLGVDIQLLIGTDEAHGWADATTRLAVGALCAIRVQLEGVLRQYLDVLPGRDPLPSQQSYLSQQEVAETAETFAKLIALDGHEKALRQWERDKERPQGKGRPRAKPEAPKGLAS